MQKPTTNAFATLSDGRHGHAKAQSAADAFAAGSASGAPAEDRDAERPAGREREADPVFAQEQAHLEKTHAALETLAAGLVAKIERNRIAAAEDKQGMVDDLTYNAASFDEALETYAAFAAVNRIIDGYNLTEDLNARKLSDVRLLLKQPYFAKVVLQFKPGDEPKELYIGNAGASDESCRRLVVDWRSPVAETYYNQDTGATSYRANGRTIQADLKLRRQFDIAGSQLRAYFDTTVAIQDALLLASLSESRTAQMRDITATIQKEQNLVVRHDDVPALIVNGIAGSGKTSVLLQRIAYLFYQRRDDLAPEDVFLITPNPVFQRYIGNVLPDLGERNPETLTWDDFAQRLMPPDRSQGETNVPLATLARIDEAVAGGNLELGQEDFRDIALHGTRLVSAAQIAQVAEKFSRIPAGPHRITLMREELARRLDNRLAQMAGTETVQGEVESLSLEEQVRIFHETIEPQDEREARTCALRYLDDRFAPARAAVENDEWLRIDRIGMRLLGAESLEPVTWLYLKMALTGLSNPSAKYVMVDEVQDYSAAQLKAIARYFRRAHFLLLGDRNQAIAEGTASPAEVRAVFEDACGAAEECSLMTSYRSTPEVTSLFASLLPVDERLRVSSVQRPSDPPLIRACTDEREYAAALRAAVADAEAAGRKQADGCEAEEGEKGPIGLTAIIAPWKHEAKKVQAILGDAAPALIGKDDALPAAGTILITLPLAKGLEFDRVIVPNANDRIFPDDPLSRRRLYTTLSRATRSVTVLANGTLTPLLANRPNE